MEVTGPWLSLILLASTSFPNWASSIRMLAATELRGTVMRRKWLAVGILVVAAPGAVTVTAAAGKPAATSVRCTINTKTQSSNASGTKGYDLGKIGFPPPLGAGLEYDKFLVTVTGTTATVTGPFNLYFNQGTIHGTFKLKSTSGSSGTTTSSGKLKVTGGTGAFKRAGGTGTISGTSTTPSNGPTASHYKAHLTLTGIGVESELCRRTRRS